MKHTETFPSLVTIGGVSINLSECLSVCLNLLGTPDLASRMQDGMQDVY